MSQGRVGTPLELPDERPYSPLSFLPDCIGQGKEALAMIWCDGTFPEKEEQCLFLVRTQEGCQHPQDQAGWKLD